MDYFSSANQELHNITVMEADKYFMKKALEQAKKALYEGEVPVGAVLIQEDKVISEACNRKESLNDPTAHAEILAIKEASQKLGSWRLNGATLYVTKEPCPMCAGAIVQARIERLVFGAKDDKAGAAGTLFNLLQDKRLNHQLEVASGVSRKECKELLQKFFSKLRSKF